VFAVLAGKRRGCPTLGDLISNVSLQLCSLYKDSSRREFCGKELLRTWRRLFWQGLLLLGMVGPAASRCLKDPNPAPRLMAPALAVLSEAFLSLK
jgi:hypothetical protein